MNALTEKKIEALASDVSFDADMMHIQLRDGRVISVPLDWFPKLRGATASQRKKWRLIGKGVGIHWGGGQLLTFDMECYPAAFSSKSS